MKNVASWKETVVKLMQINDRQGLWECLGLIESSPYDEAKRLRREVAADMIEMVAPLYERQWPNDNRIRVAIRVIRTWARAPYGPAWVAAHEAAEAASTAAMIAKEKARQEAGTREIHPWVIATYVADAAIYGLRYHPALTDLAQTVVYVTEREACSKIPFCQKEEREEACIEQAGCEARGGVAEILRRHLRP